MTISYLNGMMKLNHDNKEDVKTAQQLIDSLPKPNSCYFLFVITVHRTS